MDEVVGGVDAAWLPIFDNYQWILQNNNDTMPNTTPVFRQRAILSFLKRGGYPSFKDIQAHVNGRLENQFLIDGKTKPGFSKRTFERDIKDIDTLFGSVIFYNATEGGYYVDSTQDDYLLEKLFEAHDVLNTLRFSQNFRDHIQFEARKAQGSEHLHGILHAIQNKFVIKFSHQKFWEDNITIRKVKPLAIKEFRHRWYLIAEDEKDNKVKTIGLDRISDLEITPRKFTFKNPEKAFQKFKDSFGVIASENEEPAEIVLSFTPFQGKYIKSLPLHHSQKIQIDNETETVISLYIYATHDFIMELLSYGKEVKVVSPIWLKQKLKDAHLEAAKD
jgi:predicted DNA-binding transcriptional regulator YafY